MLQWMICLSHLHFQWLQSLFPKWGSVPNATIHKYGKLDFKVSPLCSTVLYLYFWHFAKWDELHHRNSENTQQHHASYVII